MQAYIAKVGRGQKTSKDLTWEESKQAMTLLIEGQASPEQVGAFLVAMRLKMESVIELAAFTSVARRYVPPLHLSGPLPLVDVPMYSGKKETFHVSIGAAIVAAAGGVAILMHGVEAAPDRSGPTGVLQALGIATELSGPALEEHVMATGFGYLNVALYHPPVAHFLQLKSELGLRNFFHPVARMLNPGRASAQVIGISHPPYMGKIAEALVMLGSSRALVLRGVEGEPELSLASLTKLVEVREGRITPLTLHPKDVGLTGGYHRDMAGYPSTQVKQEATLLERILHGEVKGGPRDWVAMNAALLLYTGGKAPSIPAAFSQAMALLESGKAAKKLEELRPGVSSRLKEGHIQTITEVISS